MLFDLAVAASCVEMFCSTFVSEKLAFVVWKVGDVSGAFQVDLPVLSMQKRMFLVDRGCSESGFEKREIAGESRLFSSEHFFDGQV